MAFKNIDDNALDACYRVSYLVLLNRLIVENLIELCVKDVVTTMIGEEHAINKLIDCIQLSDITISKRVKYVSNFCENEHIRRLKSSEYGFTTQFDETTDMAGLSILLFIVRYMYGKAAQKYILICKSLPTRATAEEFF
ncbi:transposase [Nephila pilipes]|uniref:Transposase n=1 Tax=Nephila pilipes TaxID=299642 RepID=A0A8X6QCU6_NEPPI|nr:transposase [Nephila pilipes]